MSQPTKEQAIRAAGEVLAAGRVAAQQMTPRELAEAAWTPTCGMSVDELEEQIRAERGMRRGVVISSDTGPAAGQR
jgi:hypothetical protein